MLVCTARFAQFRSSMVDIFFSEERKETSVGFGCVMLDGNNLDSIFWLVFLQEVAACYATCCHVLCVAVVWFGVKVTAIPRLIVGLLCAPFFLFSLVLLSIKIQVTLVIVKVSQVTRRRSTVPTTMNENSEALCLLL